MSLLFDATLNNSQASVNAYRSMLVGLRSEDGRFVGHYPVPMDLLLCKQRDYSLWTNEMGRAREHEIGALTLEVVAHFVRHTDVSLAEQLAVERYGKIGISRLLLEEIKKPLVVAGQPGDEHVREQGFDEILLVQGVDEQLDL